MLFSQKPALFLLPVITSLMVACGGGGSSSGGGLNIPDTYTFETRLDGETGSSVSYTGQTARQLAIADITELLGTIDTGAAATDETAEIVALLNTYIYGDVVDGDLDDIDVLFDLDGETVEPMDSGTGTYKDISTGKNLSDKIAGGNGSGGGETSQLIDGEFFGWDTDSPTLPIDLVDQLISDYADNAINTVPFFAGTYSITENNISPLGIDYQQLVQKFLLMAVTFSQGTNDYLQTDFFNNNNQDGSSPYTISEHKWDEAFGYFGAARDYNDYTDQEIAGKGGRAEYENGYYDTSGDGLIDVRSEINLANSSNCGKRDLGSAANANPTNYTKEAFDAFLEGRAIVNAAAETGSMTPSQLTRLNGAIETAAITWEKCIAATVVHYINEVVADMNEFSGGDYASASNFKNLAKHWSEMKGFALGLQFNPLSPFRTEETGVDVDDLKDLLADMGDAPVLADGSQNGGPAPATAIDRDVAIAAYINKLESARDTLQTAYAFDTDNVTNW